MLDEFIHYDARTQQMLCSGDWDLSHLNRLESLIPKVFVPQVSKLIINGHAIHKMDSSGAWILIEWTKRLNKKGITIEYQGFSSQAQTLINILEKEIALKKEMPQAIRLKGLAAVGYETIQQLKELNAYLKFVGQLACETWRLLFDARRWRWSSFAMVIYRTGFQALPIIAVLSFLIGVVLTYQMGLQLKNYGANIYIVDLIGLSVLREFGPLITAIMVAGRTGSAFTAQLGMMKLNQEVDALNTIGITSAELLLIPRILGLLIALPLLTMWADIFGIVGGMVMSNSMLGLTWYDFLARFPHVIPLKTFLIGLGKTPIFALIIASVGCFEGMQVKNSAESVGLNTTKSVVLSIFFIIVADAMFSVILSKLKL